MAHLLLRWQRSRFFMHITSRRIAIERASTTAFTAVALNSRWEWYYAAATAATNYAYICVCGRRPKATGNYQRRMYIISRCIASTIKATTAEVTAVTPSIFKVILEIRCCCCCCCCYTSNNFYGGVAETNTSVMENNYTQKVPMRIHQATTTDDQANHVKDKYVLIITKVSISSAANIDEAILRI